jgi:hypothetical protein
MTNHFAPMVSSRILHGRILQISEDQFLKQTHSQCVLEHFADRHPLVLGTVGHKIRQLP